jgi:hypothetical protein
MHPLTCVLLTVIVSVFPHWTVLRKVPFLLYVRTSDCWLHLPCHILQSVDLYVSIVTTLIRLCIRKLVFFI